MKVSKRKGISCARAVMWRVSTLVLAIGLFVMGYLTITMAQQLQKNWEEENGQRHMKLLSSMETMEAALTQPRDSGKIHLSLPDISHWYSEDDYHGQTMTCLVVCNEEEVKEVLPGEKAAGDTITVKGETFQSIPELAGAYVQAVNYEGLVSSLFELRDLRECVIIDDSYTLVLPDLVSRQEQDYGYWVTITHCYPLRSAMLRLLPVYLITLLGIGVFLVLLHRRLRRSLTEPLQKAVACLEGGEPCEPGADAWKEPCELLHELLEHDRQLKEQTRSREEALSRVKDVEERRRVLVSNITHELKTPLAIIHSYAEGLAEGIGAGKEEKYLQIIREQTHRMSQIIREMTDLTLLEEGRVRLSKKWFNLSDMVHQVMESMRLLIVEKNLKLDMEPQELWICADEQKIRQVVTNYASNAVRYTPRGGGIWIRMEQGENESSLIMGNESQPLSPETLDRLWDSFYRGEKSRSSGGTGLGLTIARAIITGHGGTCRVENTDRGVEFRFTLPDQKKEELS